MKGIRTFAVILGLCTVVVVMLVTSAMAADKADYVFKNGAIYTIDSKNPKPRRLRSRAKTSPMSEPTRE